MFVIALASLIVKAQNAVSFGNQGEPILEPVRTSRKRRRPAPHYHFNESVFGQDMAIEKQADLDVPPRAQAIRVILTELQRISSHLVWLGTHALDMAAMSVFLYCFRERELILDIYELCSAQRMMTTLFRPGGLWRDVPVEFEEAVRQFIKSFPARVDEYERLLTKNPLFLRRTKNIGVLPPEVALRL